MVWIISFKLWPLYWQYSHGERPDGPIAGVDIVENGTIFFR
jgi:hypothetical protein